MYINHRERHRNSRANWLRAAVLGANDGIISTASLLIGVAAAHATKSTLLITGVAALIAGCLSMGAGEYISVSSQSDIEKADISREIKELETDHVAELEELTGIYEARGVERQTAEKVAQQLMAKNALEAHARDELGISELTTARPFQAASFSAISFTLGALIPLLVLLVTPLSWVIISIFFVAVIGLALLGGVAANTGGASIKIGILRVVIWGTIAMSVSIGIGLLLGQTV